MEKCEKVLDAHDGEIVLHGMGAAIDRTINLALQLQQKYLSTIIVDPNTSTVPLKGTSSNKIADRILKKIINFR